MLPSSAFLPTFSLTIEGLQRVSRKRNKLISQPGIFPSEMTAGDSDKETHKSDLSDTEKGKGLPAGRPGQEEDMAAATLYLASYGGVL